MTPVDFTFLTPEGLPVSNAEVDIQLTQGTYDGHNTGVVVPRQLTVYTDSNGRVTIALESTSVPYQVTVYDSESDVVVRYKITVPALTPPNTSLRFQDLITDAPMPTQVPYDVTAVALILDAKANCLAAETAVKNYAKTATDADAHIVTTVATINGQASQTQSFLTDAQAAATSAVASASAANTSAVHALASETNAATSASVASTSALNAKGSETNAATSASNAAISAGAADSSRVTAGTHATNAGTSASAANTSALAASGSAGTAAASANAASISASNSLTSEANAANSATTSSTQAGVAIGQANIATTQATLAKDWATKTSNEVVGGQGFGAKKYANDASTSAGQAAQSATNAATSAGNAATSATNASTSAGNAHTSEVNAHTSELAAGTSATTAAAWAVSVSSPDNSTLQSAKTYAAQAAASAATASSSANAVVTGQIQSDWNQTDNTQKSYIVNKPNIPAPQVQADWAETNVANKGYIFNKPTLAPVATNGQYSSLTGLPALKPVATTGAYPDLTGKPVLATVATTGSYPDLTDRPVLGPVATSNLYADLNGKPVLAPVANTGVYGDLTGKPNIPSQYTDALARASISVTGSLGYNQTTGVISYTAPVLAPVASTGSFTDLLNKPSIPSDTAQLTNSAGFITSASVPVVSVQGRTGTVTITKADLSLANVDNTADINKPVSTATQTALNLKQDVSAKDIADGYVGKTGHGLNLFDSTGAFKSVIQNTNSAARIYNFPDKAGTVALTSDLPNNTSGVKVINQDTVITSEGYYAIMGNYNVSLPDLTLKPNIILATLSNNNGVAPTITTSNGWTIAPAFSGHSAIAPTLTNTPQGLWGTRVRTPPTLASATLPITPTSQGANIQMASGKIVQSFNSATQLTLMVIDPATNTFGSATAALNSTSGGVVYMYVIDASTFVLFYNDADTSRYTGIICTVAGTTITMGSKFAAAAAGIPACGVVQISTTQYTYTVGSTVYLMTISAGAITFYSTVVASGGTYLTRFLVEVASATKLFVVYFALGTTNYLIKCQMYTISGTSLVLSTLIAGSSEYYGSSVLGGLYPVSSGNFILVSPNAAGTGSYITLFHLNGANMAFSEGAFASNIINYGSSGASNLPVGYKAGSYFYPIAGAISNSSCIFKVLDATHAVILHAGGAAVITYNTVSVTAITTVSFTVSGSVYFMTNYDGTGMYVRSTSTGFVQLTWNGATLSATNIAGTAPTAFFTSALNSSVVNYDGTWYVMSLNSMPVLPISANVGMNLSGTAVTLVGPLS